MSEYRIDKMKIWNSLEKTDPKYTKQVNMRGGFTAIDAQWQIMKVTEIFGVVGQGWGYSVTNSTEGNLAVSDVVLWFVDRKNTYGAIRGAEELYTTDKNGNQRTDTDAWKKAMTNALTKGLSHIGSGADVFLGKYDDNSYVQKVHEEFRPENKIDKEKIALIDKINFLAKSLEDGGFCFSKEQKKVLSLISGYDVESLKKTVKQIEGVKSKFENPEIPEEKTN